jgi:predicted molibdopterin-dependent oxidoreductase YjgC
MRPEAVINFSFNGLDMKAIPGQSIAAAIFQEGIQTLRTTRIEGEERSIFCGIGMCWDCIVTINGRANQRACLIEVREGMVVTS